MPVMSCSSVSAIRVSSLQPVPDMERAAGPGRSAALVFAAHVGNKKAVDPIRPTTRGVWLAALPPLRQLEMGTDLPSTPSMYDGRSHRAIGALMRRFIAV
jgi:hypothetical protein